MTKEATNYTAGPRGINLEDGTTHWVQPGETVDLSELKVKGKLPDFGKASDQADKDADEVVALRARVAELEAQVAALDGDGDGKPGGSQKANPPALTGKNKEALLEIAKAEGVTIEDGATNADIVSAIELAREEAAQG